MHRRTQVHNGVQTDCLTPYLVDQLHSGSATNDGTATTVASDSQVALTMARNPTNKRSRHIGYRLQFVRDAVDYLQTRPHYVGTLAQPADLLTKPGTASSLEQYGDLLGGIGTCPQTRQLFPGLGG